MLSNRENNLSSILILYTLTTLFLGKSVLQKVGIDLGNEGIIANIHYISFPILFYAYFKKYGLYYFKKSEKFYLIFSFSYLFFIIVILDRSANISYILNNVIEPILLVSILRKTNEKTFESIRNIIIVFFIFECCVAIFEGISQKILFAKVEDFDSSMINFDMRAYSLHGHPLQNAFIVSIISTLILSYTRISFVFRYSLFLLGYAAIFSFNTRSSILFLGLILIINVFRDIFYANIKKSQKIGLILFLIIFIPIVANFIINNNLGSRLSRQMNSDDDSSMARFILVTILSELSINELLLGSERAQFFQQKYRLIAIENSIVNTIFYYGIIYAGYFYYIIFKKLREIKVPNFQFILIIALAFLLINTNNVLSTTCPILPVTILTMYSLYTPNKIIRL